MVKVTGTLQKSTEIMKLSNALIKLPQISHAMRELSMEMRKVGICAMDTCYAHDLIGWHHGRNVGGHTGYRG